MNVLRDFVYDNILMSNMKFCGRFQKVGCKFQSYVEPK